MRRWLRVFLIIAAITAAWGVQAQQSDKVPVTSKSAEVARALEKFHGRPMLLVFAPGLWGDYCKQSAELASHAGGLHNLHVGVAWLLAHDAGAMNCGFSNSVNDVEFKAEGPSGGPLKVYQYFNVPKNTFCVILLGKRGEIKLRSLKPVRYEEIRQRLDAPAKE
jgi:hypothetical protein